MGKFQQAVDCLQDVQNGGFSAGCLDLKHAKHVLTAPAGSYLTPAQVAALQSTITAKSIADAKSERWFMSAPIAAIEDKSEEAVSENVQLVGPQFLRHGFNAFDYRFIKGGMCAHKARESMNGMQDLYDHYIIDAGNTLWGNEANLATGAPIFRPFTTSDMNAFLKWPEGSKSASYMWHLGFADPREMQRNMVGVRMGFEPSLITGLKQVNLQFIAETASNVFRIGAYTGCGTVNMITNFSAAMTVGYWLAKNAETGAVCTITSVTAATNGWSLVMDTADTDYPAIGGYFTLEWIAPSTLPVSLRSYESNKIMVVRTA